jgi:Rhodopirellula transposase DDE domain
MAELIITRGDPWRVNVHDFEDKKLGKVVALWRYDMTTNAAFVSVGITSDTAEFVVRSIRCRRERMGGARPTMIENFSRVCPAIGLSGLAAYRIGFRPTIFNGEVPIPR